MPFKTDGTREYRSFFNSFSVVSDTGYIVEGYATTFDVPYDFAEDWKECVKKEALQTADLSDVIFQLNHEGQTLARQRNNTLELKLDDHGLYVKADLAGSQAGRDLYEAIKSGLIDKMSWGFSIADDGYTMDEQTHTSFITKIKKVYDVSAVSIPANQDTNIHARSYLSGALEQRKLEQLRRDKQKALLALKVNLLNVKE